MDFKIHFLVFFFNHFLDVAEFWDLTMRYRFLKHWQVRASILNLFDDRVEWVRGYLMPERNYRAGVSYTF